MKTIRTITEDALVSINISPDLNGFVYICDAVDIVVNDGRIPTVGLYSRIAEKNDTTPSRVERSIRHAFENAYKSAVLEDIHKWIGAYEKPTNSSSIYTLAIKVRRELENENNA